jgi:hypothetical protein
MPGLRLTPAQAQRLWNLTRSECERLLHALVDSRFLKLTRDGSFVLFDANSPAVGFEKADRRTGRAVAPVAVA